MNFSTRISRIAARMYPIREGACANERQDMYRLRIRRCDIIKKELIQWPEDKREEVLSVLEEKAGIKQLT